jgi:phage terminase large subunit
MRASRQQLERATEAVIARSRATASVPRVLWAGIGEAPAAFMRRVKPEAARAGLLLCVVPHGLRCELPASVRRVELPPKHFRVLHPANKRRYRVLRGGRGAAKSWSIARVLILTTLVSPARWLCAREFQKSIAESAHRLLADQIQALGLSRWFDVKNSSITSHCGAEFIFEGLFANASKLKSLEGLDGTWVEEAAKVSAASWELLIPTIRKPGSEIIVNFNPEDENDPTYERFVTSPPPDAEVIHVSYRDNPWFPPELERERQYLLSVDADAHAHVWEGECRRQSDAQILKGKVRVEAFEPQPDWHGPYQGADWGFSQDPTTLVRCWVSADRRKLYIEHESYGIGVDIDATPAMFARDVPDAARYRTRADSARPETISYMQRHGFPEVVSVTKRPGSVEDGVAHLRQYEAIVIHPRCTHAQEEARLYAYKVDRLTGDVLPIILDKHNHIWDAVRYALEPVISQGASGLLAFMESEYAEQEQQKRDRQTDAGVKITSVTREGHTL